MRSAVSRLSRYGSASRASDLLELDTFVLDDVLGALEVPRDEAGIRRAAALIEVAAHVTGRPDRILPGDGLDAARAAVERWQSFWTVYRADYTTDAGVDRVAWMVLETRYGKWAFEAVTHRFGRTARRAPIRRDPSRGSLAVLDQLRARVPVTLGIVLAAILLAYLVAVPLGVAAGEPPRAAGSTWP